MQNNQGIMQISENKDGSAKVLFRIRKAEMADVDEIMAVMHEAKNDKEHPDWFVSDDEEYVRTHIEEQGFVIVAQTADGSVAGFFLIKYPENREDIWELILILMRNSFPMLQSWIRQLCVVHTGETGCRGICWKKRRDCWIQTNIII